jgi:hypothetical protein
MPAFYTRAATVYEREIWKLEKETFEKFDEAETTLHATIVESLSQGIRTINTQHAAGISSLTALQLVEVMHTLYSTPTLQDITTVENDLKRPLAHFEVFLDHVTDHLNNYESSDHLNNYESLRSFNQQVSNITKIQWRQTTRQQRVAILSSEVASRRSSQRHKAQTARRTRPLRLYASATFGSPTFKIFHNAQAKGWLSNYPSLTAKILSRNQPHSATALGHITASRSGIRSTKPKTPVNNKHKRSSSHSSPVPSFSAHDVLATTPSKAKRPPAHGPVPASLTSHSDTSDDTSPGPPAPVGTESLDQ